jgi:uncharacterized protein
MMVSDIESLVARAGTDPVWGYAHCLRVHDMAQRLAREERLEYDEEILRISCLLHDIGLYKAYNLKEGADHVARSVRVAERLLRERSFPPRATRTVLDAIEHHSPDSKPGRSVEATLLKEAVALDYLGNIGVARVMAMVGSEDEVPDFPAAVHHIEVLSNRVPLLLRLGSSRLIARERVAEMNYFVRSLSRETAGLNLL